MVEVHAYCTAEIVVRMHYENVVKNFLPFSKCNCQLTISHNRQNILDNYDSIIVQCQ
jgi:hypothetical protein